MRTLTAAAQARRDAIALARAATLDLLAGHNRFAAGLALARSAVSSFNDFMTMRSAILAGGVHTVRLRGGRSIDRR